MTIEERIEAEQKLIEEVKAELAAKATPRRNWPEKVEAGMCFGNDVTETIWMATDKEGLFVCIRGESDSGRAIGLTIKSELKGFKLISHARDILTIRTDAHEPTGAELVGRRVNCFDTLDQLQFEGVCDEYDPDATYPYRIGKARYFKARLAK